MTDAERKLWQGLLGRQMAGHKFRRQFPLGPYIVDFVCLHARLVIEVDGRQHLDSAEDRARDAWLSAQGFTVLRFWDNEVLRQTRDVLERVWDALHPHPGLLPSRGKEKTTPGGQLPALSPSMEEEKAPAYPNPAPSPLTGEGWGGGEVGAADPDEPSGHHDR